MNAINNGIDEKPEAIKTCMTGIKRTVTGMLSRNPERIDVMTKTKMHSKKRLFGEIVTTKSSIIPISPTLSRQNTKTNKLIKKKGNLKSTLEK